MTLERIVHQDAAQIGMARAKADISVVDFIGMFKKNQRNQFRKAEFNAIVLNEVRVR